MASRKLEDRLDQLKQLRNASPDAAFAPVGKALEDRSNLIVAEAAKIAGELQLAALVPRLLACFDRLFEDPVKSDPKCWGKTAIVKALVSLDYAESPAFLKGLRHVQMEPVWGGAEDAAGKLRANSVLALVQCTDIGRPEIFRHLADALADPLDAVRIEAIRALEQMNGDEAALLLRLKAHMGDRRPHITGQVFDSLLALEPDRSLAFVARFLDSPQTETRDEAALSMGASRLPSAVKVLLDAWQATTDREFGGVLLRSLSSSRDSTALDFLLSLLRTGTSREATAALEALQLHKDSPEIQQMVEEAKRVRASAEES